MVREGKEVRSQKSEYEGAAVTRAICMLGQVEMDMDYKDYLLSIIAKKEKVESKRQPRERDEHRDEEETDPRYARFLESLKEDDKSYVSKYKENGLIVTLKYEGDSSSDGQSVVEPGRKKRIGPSSRVETQNIIDSVTGVKSLSRRQTRSMLVREINEKAKLCDLIEDDPPSFPKEKPARRNNPKAKKEEEDITRVEPQYDIFFKIRKNFKRQYAYSDGVREVVYEVKSGDSNRVKEEHIDNDGSYSDVETLDSSTFYRMNDSSMGKSTSPSEFRLKVITLLREPFDEDEYEKLWQDIKDRKPEERHLDLRNGRERSYGKQNYGKSYLDHHPALKRKVLQVKDDKPKCLNLLRGFFLWLQQPYWFSPWLDDECLAIYPESS